MTLLRTKRALGALGLAVVATAVLMSQTVLAGSGTASEEAGGDANWVETWRAPEGGAETAAIASGAENIEFVSLDVGCRIFDTRNSGGTFGKSEARDLSVLNALVPGQGGKGGGCDIPAHALAVDLSLSTTGGSPSGSGWVKAGPGGTAPKPTVLQFLKGQGTSVTTTTPLSTSSKMRLQVFNATTHLVGDVLGYWQRILHASVSPDGTLDNSGDRSSGVASVIKHGTFDGWYIINFERDITECSTTVSSYTSSTDAHRAQAILNGTGATSGKQVFVTTFDGTTREDKHFELVVRC